MNRTATEIDLRGYRANNRHQRELLQRILLMLRNNPWPTADARWEIIEISIKECLLQGIQE